MTSAVASIAGQLKEQRREYLRLFLLFMEGLQRIDSDLRPVALALVRRGLVSDKDVQSAENVLAADLAAHPDAGAVWRAIEELKRLTEQLDRETDST